MGALRLPMLAGLSAFLVFAPPARTQRFPQGREGSSATVCDIANNPERYDGKIVRIPAVLTSGRESTVLSDSERRCSDIWVAGSDSTDPSLERLEKALSARLKNKRHPLDFAPPRYAIDATFIGRLQYTHDSGFMVDGKHRVTSIKGGFGHLGQYKTQFHLQSVTDLHTRDLLGSVYKTSEFEPLE